MEGWKIANLLKKLKKLKVPAEKMYPGDIPMLNLENSTYTHEK